MFLCLSANDEIQLVAYDNYRQDQVSVQYISWTRVFSMQSDEANESQDIFEGRWLKDQHDRFLVGIMEHGKDWKIVEKVVKTRTGSQVRSHAQKFFIKLNKINKERKKGKNLELIQPSDIQRQILEQFTQKDITSNTPTQISVLIRKDWNAVAAMYKEKKKQTKPHKQIHNKKQIGLSQNLKEQKQKEQVSHSNKNFQQQDQDQSYFIKIMQIADQFRKMNKQHFISGHDFKELIDFKQISHNFAEQSHTSIVRQNKRKRSFCLPDSQENETKLKQTLSNLHRILGYED